MDVLLQAARDGSVSAREALWTRYGRLMARFTRAVRRDEWWSAWETLEYLAVKLGAW